MQGKICLITGATNGIGLEIARCLAERNATVVLVGRNPEKTQRVVDELRQSTGNQDIDFPNSSPVTTGSTYWSITRGACSVGVR